MPGFDAPLPPSSQEPEDGRGTSYGRILFIVYLFFYGGYVFLTAFAPDQMNRTPLGGINLSVLYGLGLIFLAILMAIVYDLLCHPAAAQEHSSRQEDTP